MRSPRQWGLTDMRLVYIAGPYRAETLKAVTQNVRRAVAEATTLLFQHGIMVICPHSMSHSWEKAQGFSEETLIAGDCELVRRCDAVLLLPGWAYSTGTAREREAAIEAGVPVFENRQELLKHFEEV